MSGYGGVNSSHIYLLPCEDVFVLSQEMGKRASEVFHKLGANVGEVFRVVIQQYRFQLFRGLRSGVHDRTRPGYPSKVPRVVPPSEVSLYNP